MDPNKFTTVKEFVSQLSRKDAKDLLKKWREENDRNAELVREIWVNPELSLQMNLGDEKWQVLEQVCIAALDLHDKALVKECLTKLQEKFPNSNRVRRLRLMANLELNERWVDSLKEYDQMLTEDESNSLVYKRKIAILIAAGRPLEAISNLCEYLKHFMNDHEAWIQLANLYIREQEYVKAAFCLEELILTSPHNHLYHERYAEIQYTIGTSDALELARAYFAQAVRLKPTSLRALYGLLLTCNSLSALSKISEKKRKECKKLAQMASKQIATIYQSVQTEKSEEKLDSLNSALASLQLA